MLDLLDACAARKVRCWLDGGWGVDALLGQQSRPHGDLDLVVVRDDLASGLSLLAERGFVVLRDWLPTAIALRDPAGREVDLHPVDGTDDNGGDQRLADGSTWHYGPPTHGTVAGRPVLCCPAPEQLAMHEGYPPRPSDVADVRLLAARFGLAVPAWAEVRSG